MKYTFTFLITICFICTLYAQKVQTTLFLKDGTTLEGYAFGNTSWDVTFRKELKKGKKKTYQFEELDSLSMIENYVPITYHIKKYRFSKNQKN